MDLPGVLDFLSCHVHMAEELVSPCIPLLLHSYQELCWSLWKQDEFNCLLFCWAKLTRLWLHLLFCHVGLLFGKDHLPSKCWFLVGVFFAKWCYLRMFTNSSSKVQDENVVYNMLGGGGVGGRLRQIQQVSACMQIWVSSQSKVGWNLQA